MNDLARILGLAGINQPESAADVCAEDGNSTDGYELKTELGEYDEGPSRKELAYDDFEDFAYNEYEERMLPSDHIEVEDDVYEAINKKLGDIDDFRFDQHAVNEINNATDKKQQYKLAVTNAVSFDDWFGENHEDLKYDFDGMDESAKAKPDFADIDNDGDEDEDMKKAAKDKENKENANEAVGEFAAPLYDLIDNHGAEAVLDELVRYLDVDQIDDFVSDYKRHHDDDLLDLEYEGAKTEPTISESKCCDCDDCGPDCDCDCGCHEETVTESPTMNTTDLVILLKNAGLTEDEHSAEDVSEAKERPYVCVHAKKGKHECHADSSYGAAQKAATHWKLKSTAGIDAYLADVEQVAEATAQLVNMLKNAGLSEAAIEEKLNEWANTPEGVGEVEPTEHGDAYDFAQSVNLSLKRYLDAQDMKVSISESHTVEGMKNKYNKQKNK